MDGGAAVGREPGQSERLVVGLDVSRVADVHVAEVALSGVELRPTADDSGVTWQVSGADTAARVALAWDGLRISHPGRLRPCANTACHLFLLDRSRPNNARWCSMAVCGNRMKARRHYQRTRG